MKINLLYDSNNILSGFVNIDPCATEGDGKVLASPADLNELCEDAECDMIIADDVIDYFSSLSVDAILDHWISKLRHGGKIIISGIDILEVSKALYHNQLDLVSANMILFGEQSKPWKFRKSSLSSSQLVKALRACGLKIIKNRIQKYKYTIEAERP